MVGVMTTKIIQSVAPSGEL